jgi:hypothetical protein
MSETQILDEHPDLEQADFPAVYQFAAETGRHTSPAIPAPPYQPWMTCFWMRTYLRVPWNGSHPYSQD